MAVEGEELRRRRAVVTLCLSVALALLCGPATALAGPPVHQPLGSPVTGLNHACGTAVDSQGDLYVSSAGESKIEIFDSTYAEIGSVEAGLTEPCGLAVDTEGNLYVSDSGDVVRYHPTAYPFSGVPSYEAPETVDASGAAKGISVDPYDDYLYVAEGEGITAYKADGTLVAANDEVQEVLPSGATGGTFKLRFEGVETTPLPYNATHAEVEAALEALSTVGAGNASVSEGSPSYSGRDHIVTFKGALANTDVPLLEADISSLVGSGFELNELTKGYSGQIGSGEMADASGVAVRTDPSGRTNEYRTRYVYATDASDDRLKIFQGEIRFGVDGALAGQLSALELHRQVSGPSGDEEFEFEAAGADLVVDPGNGSSAGKCDQVAEQACTAWHLFLYDAGAEAVEEFDASGEYFDRIEDPSFEGAEPTAIAIDRSGDSNDGTIYVTSDAGNAAKVLAFAPLVQPGRRPLGQGKPPEPPSQVLPTPRAVATDSHGNLYAAAGKVVHVFDPSGAKLTNFEDPEQPFDLAIDSGGNVYVLDNGSGVGTAKVTYYAPSSYPPSSSTTYSRHATLATTAGWPARCGTPGLSAITVDPLDDHLFIATVSNELCVRELGSAEEESPILDPEFATSLPMPTPRSIDVCGKTGEVFFGGNPGHITVVNAGGTEVVARINGVGSPRGPLPDNPKIAVDQSNCHVLAFDPEGETGREHDSRGGFVAEFGHFAASGAYDIAIDSACAIHRSEAGKIEPLTTTQTCAEYDPGSGRAYVAHDEATSETPDIWAFDPLSYGEPPLATTGTAGGIGGGKATLNGAVNPLNFELEGCSFEYLTDAAYEQNLAEEKPPFEGATAEPCAETPEEIGSGEDEVPVHVTLEGLNPEGRYRFRAAARNKYGKNTGTPSLFGPPVLTLEPPTPLYDEAVLRAKIESAGLPTSYRFECGPPEGNAGEYDRSTPTEEVPAGEGGVAVQAIIGGLQEGVTYHCRLVAKNEASEVLGEDQRLTTLLRRGGESCPNAEFRTGLSASLPDCRAYELVTPAQTGGLSPGTREASGNFNNWLTVPRGEAAGERLSFFTQGTIEGFEGNGRVDGYLAERGPGDHPTSGWSTQLAGPTFDQASGVNPFGEGVSADQLYSAWHINPEGNEPLPGTLAPRANLRAPGQTGGSACNLQPLQSDFETVGCGDLGTDLQARLNFISAGGDHVLFSSKKPLEEEAGNQAPSDGTMAIYDRAVSSSHARVLSLQPDGTPFSADATYIAASADGSSVVFGVGATLYERRGGETLEVGSGATFAGLSPDGSTLTYTQGGKVFSFDAAAEPPVVTEVAEGTPVNVSPDGSHVFFTSEAVLTGTDENENCNPDCETAEAGAHNLYAAAGGTVRFVGILAQPDFEGFDGLTAQSLGFWTLAQSEEKSGERAKSPTRSIPNGGGLVFQSHARLTSYDNEGVGEVYRYDPSAAEGERLLCVSCNPAEISPTGEAVLQDLHSFSPVNAFSTMIANVTDDGSEVFFQSPDRLLPEDANEAQDVYAWRAKGTGEPQCTRAGGCLALISSGQGEGDSFLYSASADGHDVFFRTEEKLVGADVAGSKSIYDARVDGGIPDARAPEPCGGDACQPAGGPPPVLSSPASAAENGDGNVGAPHPGHCAKGIRTVRRGGRVRCLKRHAKKHHHRRAHGRTPAKRRAGR
jgi:hypothetical protein